jgi:hypothetical protein
MLKKTLLIGLLAAWIGVGAVAAYADDLTGVWSCNDGGSYYVRQLGDDVWWYGEASPDSPGWSNVANGRLHGSMLRLKWADVPKGGAMGSGTLHLEVLDDGRMVAVKKIGGFGGSEWTRY